MNKNDLMMLAMPNHNMTQVALFLAGAAGYGYLPTSTSIQTLATLSLSTTLTLFGLTKLPAALKQWHIKRKILDTNPAWMLQSDALKQCQDSAHIAEQCLGLGFVWEQSHCQAAKELISCDWHSLYNDEITNIKRRNYLLDHPLDAILHPLTTAHKITEMKNRISQVPGYPFLHAIGKEKPLFIKNKDLENHIGIFGTSGSGKTRAIEHLVTKAIADGNTVIVLDPKCDSGLEKTMCDICKATNREFDFQLLHLARPEESIHINPLANFSRTNEVASRIVDALPSQTGDSAVFNDIGRGVIHSICDALLMIGKKPTLKTIYNYILKREELTEETLKALFEKAGLGEQVKKAISIKARDESTFDVLKRLYASYPRFHVSAIDSVIALADRDQEGLMKTIVSTVNLLNRLVSGDIGTLLSPSKEDDYTFTDTRKLIEKNAVLYVGLDSLTDASMARAIGTMLLADLAACAGNRYSFEDTLKPVMLFVDEASELASEPLTQMLNKSRGAKFRVTIATQTIDDFTAKTGDPAQTMRILANLNCLLAFRCNDYATQKFFADRIVKTTTSSMIRSHTISASSNELLAQGGSIGERQVEQEAELVPPALLGCLPPNEFFGIVSGGHVIKGRCPIILNHRNDFHTEDD